MTDWRPKSGDTVRVKADGPFLNKQGVIVNIHGREIAVEFGDSHFFNYTYPDQPMCIPVRGGVVRGDIPVGKKIKHIFGPDDLWLVEKGINNP